MSPVCVPAMEISGGQGANGPHLSGLAPNSLEIFLATTGIKIRASRKINQKFRSRLRRSHMSYTQVLGKGAEKLQNS